MSSIMDYVLWRGDLTFKEYPFNEIDGLILSQLAYSKIDALIPDDFDTETTLREVAYEYGIMNPRENAPEKEYSVINPLTENLLLETGQSKRYGTIKIRCFISIFNSAKQEQFAAYSARLDDKTLCIVYRGTDETLTGWKEDLNLSYKNPIPAQQDALDYLEQAARNIHGKICIMGHSKGGNLAMYASSFCSPKTSKRIKSVYSYDGPGFISEITNTPSYIKNLKRIKSFIPQSSLVGVLLNHPNDYTIIQSSEKNGIMQHDPFSWQLNGPTFITLDSRTEESIFIEKTVKQWLENITNEELLSFLESLYAILDTLSTDSLSEVGEQWIKHSTEIIVALRKIDSSNRAAIWKIIQLFFQVARSNIPQSKGLQLFLNQFTH
ncbi:MAG: hypothetical protein BKP49_08145 [Treponema sp. CETP13]|nr:MAG: hypothetical protein BKP49_08145 [Treponema sp. CETP13]